MSQALHTSSTGINAGQQQIDVIANNVANINTTAFKSANVTFETLYSNTLSYGSAATKEGGGTNPQQIGLGTKVGGITRNFDSGTFVSTGRNLDLMISGTGFFVVQDGDGGQYFTRDGVFSLDSEGNLVTNSGMKVVGAESIYSTTSSDSTIKIPTNLRREVKGDSAMNTKKLTELNDATISSGTIGLSLFKNGTQEGNDLVVSISDSDTVQEVIDKFNNQLKTITGNQSLANAKMVDNGDGTIGFTFGTDYSIKYNASDTTSNFLAQTELSEGSSTSKILSYTVTLQDMLSNNDPDAVSLNNVTVSDKGIIAATYTDGSVLTQDVNDFGATIWKYTTSSGVTISGDDVTATGSVLSDSKFIIELATMVNQEGLVSRNNNLWEWGPDVGEMYFGMAGEMAFGALESGGYEASNVDISTELSNLITAQRMIQMNSRVFSTASSVMETLAYLGQ